LLINELPSRCLATYKIREATADFARLLCLLYSYSDMARFFGALILGVVLQVLCSTGTPLEKRAVDFFNPVNGGGSMLDNGTCMFVLFLALRLTFFPAGSGGGEPLNVGYLGLLA
jgi:hypothetical protein